jgi:hypothetical protein
MFQYFQQRRIVKVKLYSVKYRKAGALFWRGIKNVKGDCFIPNTPIMQIIQADETITGINLMDHEIEWSKDRHYSILERQSNEAGQPVKTEPR